MPQYGQQSRGAQAFGITPQSYDSYMAPVVPNMPYFEDQYGTSGQTQSQLQNLMAQRSIEAQKQLNEYDPEDEDSVNGLQRLMAIGQVPASTGNALLRQSRYYNPVQKQGGSTTGRYSPFSDEGTQALGELNSIDPTHPQAFQQMGQIIQKYPQAASDPRFISSVHQLRRDLLTYRPQRQQDPTKSVEYQLAGAGYDPSTFDQYRNENGEIPPVTAAYLISQAKSQRPLSAQEHMGLVQAYRALQTDPTDEDKVDAVNRSMGTQYTAQNLPKELWPKGFSLAKNQRIQSLTDMIGALHASGAKLPARLTEAADDMEFPSAGRQFSRIPGQPPAGASMPAPAKVAPTLSDEDPNYAAPGTAPVVAPSDAHVEPEFESAPSGLQNVQQSVKQDLEAKAAKQAAKEGELKAAVPQWEDAKQTLWSAIPKDQIDRIRSGIPTNPSMILSAIGKARDDVAFKKEGGRPVTWGEVAHEAVNDPRFKQAIGTGNQSQQVATPSGNKVSVKVLGPAKKVP